MKITWFGHSAFRLDFADKAVLIDPFFTGNPAFEGDRAKIAEGVTHILLTHGHGDHVGDTVEIAKETGAKVVTNFDLCMYLAKQGVQNFDPMNTGGTTDQGGFTVTLVRADHSAGLVEMDVNFPLGSANGIIVKAPGEPTVYHMGDTDIFGDMAPDRRDPSARRGHRADRRPLHHGPGGRGAGGAALFPASRPPSPAITAPSRSSSPTPTGSSRRWTARASRSWCRTRRSACASERLRLVATARVL